MWWCVILFFMSYSIDFRQRVVSHVRSGCSQEEAARIFNVSRKTIYRWLAKGDDVSDAPRKPYRSKLSKQALAADVRDYPDAYLRERAERFGVTVQTVWYALKRLNIRKKNS